MDISSKGLIEIISHEGICLEPYLDSVGVWTIGIGQTKDDGIDPRTAGKLTLQQAIDLFKRKIKSYTSAVDALGLNLTQYQYDALSSFCYNVGPGNLRTLCNNRSLAQIGDAFSLYHKPPEITARRNKEQALFKGGKYSCTDGRVLVFPVVKNKPQYSDGYMLDVRPYFNGVAPVVTAARNVQSLASDYSPDVERVQRSLDGMGYHEVGTIDGLMGGKTRAAIAAFHHDRGIADRLPELDAMLDAELERASIEAFIRPVAPARAYATAGDLVPKVAAVQHNAWSRFWSKLLTVPSTAGAAVWGVASNVPAANDAAAPYIAMAKQYVSGVPGWVWLAVVAAVGFAIWRSTNRSDAATVADYQTGRLN